MHIITRRQEFLNMPKISVIIPLLNKGPYIKRALDSVFAQNFKGFEVIVIDGGSMDDGPDIVKKYGDNRIKFMRQGGKGVSAARNQAVNACSSDLIAFLDADDEWLPKHLGTIIELREKFPQAGAYTTAYKIKERNGNLRWAKYRSIPPSPWEGLIPNYFRSAALGEFPVWTSAACIPKNVFMEMGGFVEDAWWGEDADLWGKIALTYPIAFSWEWGAIYHWDSEGRACGRPSLEVEPFVTTANNAIKRGLVPENQLSDVKEYVARKEIYRAACNLSVGDNKNAYSILKRIDTKFFPIRINLLVIVSKFPAVFSRIVIRYLLDF